MGDIELSIQATGDEAWRLLDRLSWRLRRPRIAFIKAVIDKRTTIKGEITNMILTDTQEVDLSIQPVDAKGNPAQVEGTPVWASSDPDVVAVAPAGDGLSCVAKAGTKLGHAQVSVTVDADLGPGVTNISGILEMDVVAGQAVAVTVVAGTPREQA